LNHNFLRRRKVERMKRKAVLGIVLVIVFLVSVFPMSKSGVSVAHSTVDPVDWWPMLHHDLTHTGYSMSTAPKTNQTLWKHKTGSAVYYSSPAVVGGVVYVGSGDSNVYALSDATGKLVWNYTTGSAVESSPAVVGGVVYVGSGDNVYAFNATTGKLVWKYTTGNSVYSSPAVAGGVVYVGSGDYSVYALNATTSKLIWKYKTGSAVESSPAVVGGVVYVGSGDSNVYALNATSGTLMWKYATGSAVFSSPAVAGGVVYVGSYDDNVYALNAATGALDWKYTTSGIVFSSPAVAGGIVYVGSGDYSVYALNATSGTLVWKYTTGNSVYSSPAVAGGIVYVGSDDYSVYALNATSGTLVWKYTTGSCVESSPAVVGGIVYLGSFDSNVYAFGLPLSVSILPGSVYMDVGQSSTFTSSVSGVASPYSYQWYLNSAPVSEANDTSWTFTPTSSGFYNVYLKVTDAMSAVATSNTVPVTVSGALSISVSPDSSTLDVGQSQLFSSSVSSGTSPYTYQWYLNGVAVPYATNSTWTFKPSSSGTYNVYVNVTDSVSFMAKSNIATVTVNPTLSVTISPTSVTMSLGQSQSFTSTVSTGTSPYSYQWYLDHAPVSGANSTSWTFTPTSAGSYTVYVKVADSVGTQATSNVTTATVLTPDVAVTNVVSSRTAVGQGFSDTINVTAADPGSYTETFSVTLYANTTAIATKTITLTSGSSAIMTFTWNTAGFARGIYTISAYAWPVPGEIILANNNFTGSSVQITKVGDFGGYAPGSDVPQFGYFDGSCGPDDIPLFIQCYRGTAPPQWMHLGDLGGYPPGSNVPQFFLVTGSCGPVDIPLFILCYRGQGP
jgi:outer membrane protein assembly factor BamB